jgi:hypothetical protein
MIITDAKLQKFYQKRGYVNNICQKISSNIPNFPTYKDFKTIVSKCTQILSHYIETKQITVEDDLYYEQNKNIFKYRELISNYYRMKLSNKAIIQGDRIHIQRSKSKLDGYCQSLKSNKLRHLYSLYFKDNTDILKNYYPATMVLTVQHTMDGFQGERFYHSQLLKLFKEFRREHKEILNGGTYNVETTYGDNGYHIHLHCFVLLPKKVEVFETYQNENNDIVKISAGLHRINIVEEAKKLNNSWKHYTGNHTSYKPLRLTSIYYISKKGKKIFYKENWSPKLFFKAFQEVCKYNMKLDNLNNLDIDTINEYLISSKNKRLFSRFGNMYDMSYLSPTNKDNLIVRHYKRIELQKLAETKRKLSVKKYKRCNKDIVFDKVKLPIPARLYDLEWLHRWKDTNSYDMWQKDKNIGSTDMKLNIKDLYKGNELRKYRGDEILHPEKRKPIGFDYQISNNRAIISDECKAEIRKIKALLKKWETDNWKLERANSPPI